MIKIQITKSQSLEDGSVSGMFKIPPQCVTKEVRYELIDLEGEWADVAKESRGIHEATTTLESDIVALRSKAMELLERIDGIGKPPKDALSESSEASGGAESATLETLKGMEKGEPLTETLSGLDEGAGFSFEDKP